MLDRIKKLISQAKGKTAKEQLDDLEGQSRSNGLKKQKIDDEIKPVTTKIQELKKRYQAASAAQKSLLQPELKQLLRRFNSLKRERGIYLENETALAEAIGRMREIDAYKSSGVNEDVVDDLAIDLDEAAAEADGRSVAIRDLEKAGRRRNSIDEGDDNFDDELAMFDEPEDSMDDELANFEDDAAEIEDEPEPTSSDSESKKSEDDEKEKSDDGKAEKEEATEG